MKLSGEAHRLVVFSVLFFFFLKTGVTGHHFENTDLIKQKRQMAQLNLKQNWPRDFHWLKKRMH